MSEWNLTYFSVSKNHLWVVAQFFFVSVVVFRMGSLVITKG